MHLKKILVLFLVSFGFGYYFGSESSSEDTMNLKDDQIQVILKKTQIENQKKDAIIAKLKKNEKLTSDTSKPGPKQMALKIKDNAQELLLKTKKTANKLEEIDDSSLLLSEQILEEDYERTPMDEAREQEEEKKKLSLKDRIFKARPIQNFEKFNSILNGVFKGKANVKRNGKETKWWIRIESYYTGTSTYTNGHTKIDVKENSKRLFYTNYNGENRLYSSHGKHWFLELGPDIYLKINKRNAKRISGAVFESKNKGKSFKRLGNFHLNRVSF
ncbi:hypothetical protein N9O57_01375 [bacterium]|nr:hypothetical protein [bacterium]